MLDFAALSANHNLAGLDFAAVALSLFEEADYLAGAIERAALDGLLPGQPGIRAERAHLHVRAHDIAQAAHAFMAMARRPEAYRAAFAQAIEAQPEPMPVRLVVDNPAPPRRATLLQRVTALMPWLSAKGRAADAIGEAA